MKMSSWKEVQSWVFDLDNTLYPASSNLFAQVDVRMRDFIAGYLKVDIEEAYTIQKKYFRESGTTLKGLMDHHDMDPEPYLAYVHDIDLSPVSPDPDLAKAIAALKGKKYIFTNASRAHAERVMARLGIEDLFDGIFDIVDAGYTPKPEPGIYDLFVERFQINPKASVMVEDIARNLKPAADLGMACVLVKTETEWGLEAYEDGIVDYETDNLSRWLSEISQK